MFDAGQSSSFPNLHMITGVGRAWPAFPAVANFRPAWAKRLSVFLNIVDTRSQGQQSPFNYAHTYTDEAVQQESEASDLHNTSYVNRVTFWMEMKPRLNRTSGNIVKVEQ